MPALTLPLTFSNSFWTPDYRKGLELLFGKLEQGVVENEEVVGLLKARAAAAQSHSRALTSLPAPRRSGFALSSTSPSTLSTSFAALHAASADEGAAYAALATALERHAKQFGDWAEGHKDRIRGSKAALLDGWVLGWEEGKVELEKLKATLDKKLRAADEADEDAKFAPVEDPVSPPPTSPPSEKSEKALGKQPEKLPAPPSKPPSLPPLDTADTAPLEPIILAGVPFAPKDLSALLKRASEELPGQVVKVPFLGEYQDCYSGEDLTNWFLAKVADFNGSADKVVEACSALAEDLELFRRIGGLGNKFEPKSDWFYQFRPKAFELEDALYSARSQPVGTPLLSTPAAVFSSPVLPSSTNVQARVGSLLQRAGSLRTALTGANPNEPPRVRARREADKAKAEYEGALKRQERQRLSVEERVEEALRALQRCELDRLRAIKTVLGAYESTLKAIHTSLGTALESSAVAVQTYQPEHDLSSLVERHRTGAFRPAPHIVGRHDLSLFGGDLRKLVRAGEEEGKDREVPEVLAALLAALEVTLGKVEEDEQKRKSWIFEVPLSATHHVRESLNALPKPFSASVESTLAVLAKYDAPVLASAIKLWALELDPPLGGYDAWEDARAVYPSVGAEGVEVAVDDVRKALEKTPLVNAVALEAVLGHLKNLVVSTKSDETDEVFFTKLALCLGRVFFRPRVETDITLQERHITPLLIDLIRRHDEVLPPLIAKKKLDADRPTPQRKRTKPIDQRLSRSRLSAEIKPEEFLSLRLEQQRATSAASGTSPRNSLVLPEGAAPPVPVSDSPGSTPTRPDLASLQIPTEDGTANQEEGQHSVVISPPTPIDPPVPAPAPAPAPAVASSPSTGGANLSRSSGSGKGRRPGGARPPPSSRVSSSGSAPAPCPLVGAEDDEAPPPFEPEQPPSPPAGRGPSPQNVDPEEYKRRGKGDRRISAGAMKRESWARTVVSENEAED